MSTIPSLTEQKQIARKMRAEGARWVYISEALGKRGVTTRKSNGKGPTQGYAHGLLNPRKKGKAKRVKAQDTSGSTNKFDLLRTIETCADLKQPTRKALIQIILQDFYK